MCHCLYAFQLFRPNYFLLSVHSLFDQEHSGLAHTAYSWFIWWCSVPWFLSQCADLLMLAKGGGFAKHSRIAIFLRHQERLFPLNLCKKGNFPLVVLLETLGWSSSTYVASRKVIQDYLVRHLPDGVAAACGGRSFCYNPKARSCR